MGALIDFLKLCNELRRLRKSPNWFLGRTTCASFTSGIYKNDNSMLLWQGMSPRMLMKISLPLQGEGFKKENIAAKEGLFVWQEGGLTSGRDNRVPLDDLS